MKYAIIENDVVVNVIEADSQELAESATGFDAVETEGVPWTGWTVHADGFRPPQPFMSWIWNGKEWESPVPKPEEGIWNWDEETLSWIEFLVDEEV